jgi:hypothetical protein
MSSLVLQGGSLNDIHIRKVASMSPNKGFKFSLKSNQYLPLQPICSRVRYSLAPDTKSSFVIIIIIVWEETSSVPQTRNP